MSASMLTRFAELAVTQLWQVTLLAIAVGLVVRLAARRRPHLAYLLWMIVVVKCLTPPVVSSPTSLFSWAQFSRMQSSSASPQVNEPPTAIATAAWHDRNDLAKRATKPRLPSALVGASEVGSASADAERTEPASIAATPSVSSTMPAAEPVNAWLQPAVVGVAVVWLAGVAIFSAIIAAKWLRTRGLWRRCAAPSATVERQLAALAQQLNVRWRVRVLVSSEHVGPAVFGVLRPTILLPAQVVLEAQPSDLEPIIAHELIHVRRGDSAASLFQLSAQLLWWFHPLIWWTNREARRERERACDEEVVAGLGYPPAQYARVLVDLLDALVRQRQPFALAGVPMLEVTARRLSHIVRDAKHFHARTPRWHWLLAAALLLIVLPGAGLTWEPEPSSAIDDRATIAEPESPQTPGVELAFVANNANAPQADSVTIADKQPTEPKVIPAATDSDSAAHRKAVAEIEKLGGVVQWVRMPDGKQFVSIGLAEKWTGGDEGVDLLKGVTDLKFVHLDCRRFTPQGVARLGQFDGLESVHLLNPVDAQLARVQGWQNVQSLDLEGGTFTDAGLAPLSTLPALKDLSLVSAAITDDAMDNLKNLAALEKLQLAVCSKLSGSKFGSLAALPNLHEIIVMVTPLSAQGLAELAKLPRLARLTLDASKFKSEDFAGLAKMTSLVHLMLNQAVTFDDAAAANLAKLTGLRNLILYNTHLTDSGLTHLRGLKSLESLLVERDDGHFTDEGLANLATLKNLQSLSLGHGRFTDEGLAAIAGLTQLRGFSLSFSLAVTDDGLAHLARMTQMKNLSITGEAVTDAGLMRLAPMTELEQLDLSQSQVTGAGFAKLGQLNRLRDVNLSNSKFTDAGMAILASFKSLEALDLTGTAVTDAGLAALTKLPRLKRLILERTKVTDAGLQQLGGIKTLHELGLGGTKVTKAGMADLKKKLPEIEIAADDGEDRLLIQDGNIPLFDVPPPPPPPPSDGKAKP